MFCYPMAALRDVSSLRSALGYDVAAQFGAKPTFRVATEANADAFLLELIPQQGRTARLDQCRELLFEYNEKNDIHYYSSAVAVRPGPSIHLVRRAADCSIPTRSVSEGQFRMSFTYVSGYDW